MHFSSSDVHASRLSSLWSSLGISPFKESNRLPESHMLHLSIRYAGFGNLCSLWFSFVPSLYIESIVVFLISTSTSLRQMLRPQSWIVYDSPSLYACWEESISALLTSVLLSVSPSNIYVSQSIICVILSISYWLHRLWFPLFTYSSGVYRGIANPAVIVTPLPTHRPFLSLAPLSHSY